MAEAPAIPGLALTLARLNAPVPIWHARVNAAQWHDAARCAAAGGARLVALWGAPASAATSIGGSVNAAYALPAGLSWLELPLTAGATSYPDVAAQFPGAARMQRAVADLLGVVADGAVDQRRWIDHGLWATGYRPLRDGLGHAGAWAGGDEALPAEYEFVRVEGEGVHEIAVGPVHAGIIEPGHFRFSVVGEKVLRLEQRLGYAHKGIAQRFTQLGAFDAFRLAGRVSGDTTVAFSWAYCMALESAIACNVPPRALHLRALMLERERIANHLGDLGALGNDAALGFALSQFTRLREDWQRASREAFGHRLMMDCIVPGGVSTDPAPDLLARMMRQCNHFEHELSTLRAVFDEHAGLQDRFMGTGVVTPQLAAQLGLTGLAGRASAQAADLRCDHPWPPYDELGVKRATQRDGDVAARVALRFDEALESLRLVQLLCAGLPAGPVRNELTLPRDPAFGAGWVEGWRGEVFVALSLGAGGAIRSCHCHDPSTHNWPVLEHAVIGNIVPDFPLVNKSFNLSYSGHDV